jgi:hypothetical protein
MRERLEFKPLKVKADTWSFIMGHRLIVTRANGFQGLETVDEVLQRLLKVNKT